MAVVDVANIAKRYGKGEAAVQALGDVSLTVEEGEFVAVFGPSGSGKTVLANIIGLLETPDSGSYHFQQTDTHTLSNAEKTYLRRENIGWVFRDSNLIPDMSAAANVELAITYDGVKARDRKFQARRLLKQVGLDDRAKDKVKKFSLEHKQRIAIARALANKPSLILADEPTGNLGEQASATIMKVFGKLQEKGHTILVMTHTPAVARQTHRHLRMNDDGYIKQAGGNLEHTEAYPT